MQQFCHQLLIAGVFVHNPKQAYSWRFCPWALTGQLCPCKFAAVFSISVTLKYMGWYTLADGLKNSPPIINHLNKKLTI